MFKQALILVGTACAVEQSVRGGAAKFDVEYDTTKKMLKFTADTADNTYFSIGFKSGMTNTDMVYFKASGAGEVIDLWSTGEVTP